MKRLIAISALVVAAACGGGQPEKASASAPQAIQPPAIDAQAVLAHTKTLSSDEFEGRAPGTQGEDLTVAYIAEQFKKAGVEPGNPDGTYFQKVPMVGITADPGATLVFRKGGREQRLKFRDDVVAWTKRVTDTVTLDRSEVVFVGYGVAGARVQLGRLQGRRPEGQDDGGPGERPADSGSRGPGAARPEDVRRPGDDVLRPLDVQVRDGPEDGRRGRAHRARDRAGRLPVRGGPGQGRRSSSTS